jgi:predicted AlkP superfamily pyrophosphatase or phosphodiesterase
MTVLRKRILAIAFVMGPLLACGAANAAPVLMISIDGLRPNDVLEAAQRGFHVPVLAGLVANGAYATGVRNVLPTVTYPNHTTLITGVYPSRHGIANNLVFDPLQKTNGAWYWYTRDLKVPTLWDAVHDAHGVVASLEWPVSVGARSIDYNMVEDSRAETTNDEELNRALSTPGLPEMLEKATGIAYADADGETVEKDVARTRYAAALIRLKHPRFMTLHLRGLDHTEHTYGPGTPQAIDALARLDAATGELIAAARKAEPDMVVAVVSDHGFAAVQHDVNLIAPFVKAGLITLNAQNKPTQWQASLWGGASVAVVLAHPNDAALKAKVGDLLKQLAADPANGIAAIADSAEIARMGGTPMASFWIDFKPGYEMGQKPDAPAVSEGAVKGTHGYFPSHPEMRATFILEGPARSVAKKGSLGEIDMRDIAPTLAKILKVSLPQADGHPLF